ncbi:MAG: glutathione S-transferase family protein [Rhodospirillaceae bacterium]
MIKLYDVPASGNCHKVRMMLSFLGLDYEKAPMNLAERDQKTLEYLAMNPIGKVPVLDDDGEIVRDSQAIVVYLAAKYGGDKWLPGDAAGLGHVMEWLSFAANEMLNGCAVARALIIFKREGDLAGAQALSKQYLEILDGHLAGRDWLVGDAPTVADIACYVYAGLVHQGEVDQAPYKNMIAWFKRIEALPGYEGMAALPAPGL